MILGFDFCRLRSGPFEGPAIVKAPALPGDTYFRRSLRAGRFGNPALAGLEQKAQGASAHRGRYAKK